MRKSPIKSVVVRATTGAVFGVTMLLMSVAGVQAQEAPAADVLPAQSDATAQPAATGHDWHPFSRSTARIYMADVEAVVVEGDVTRIPVAKVPMDAAAGDYSHNVETVEFRCSARQSRSTTEIEYGPDGSESGRYEDATEWEAYRAESRDGFLANLACMGERSASNWPSIKAWVDAGRK